MKTKKMNKDIFSNLYIRIFDKKYQASKNGMLILAKENTGFARLIQLKSEFMYTVSRERYSDYEFYESIVSNKRDLRWAIILVMDAGRIKDYRKADVEVNEIGFKLAIDDAEKDDVREFVTYMRDKMVGAEELCSEYLRQDNFLVDIKKMIMPYDLKTVANVEKSILSRNVEAYKEAARMVFFYRPAALNEYAKILQQEGDDRNINIQSLNARLSNIKDYCVDLKNKMYNGFRDCMDSFMEEFEKNSEKLTGKNDRALLDNEVINSYMRVFLEQNFYKQLNERIRIKPDTNLYEIHMGKNWFGNRNGVRSLYISPRFRDGKWENDNSEIRRVKFQYYTIGHLLTSGLVVEKNGKRVLKKYNNFDDALEDLYPEEELEKDEQAFVQCYLNYVSSHSDNMLNIPLLIPQFRFGGEAENHVYRADFLLLNYCDRNHVRKILIELSRNYLHDKLGEQDAVRRNDFIQKYNCLTIEIRDRELENLEETFTRRIVAPGYLM